MAQSPEDELEEFLKPLPSYMQKALWYDMNMSQQEVLDWMHTTNPFPESQIQEFQAKIGWQPDLRSFNEAELRRKFEEILQRCDPAEWKRYGGNAKAARNSSADWFVQMPRGKPGRKRNVKLAEQIWSLHGAGMTSREIKTTLEATSGLNISVEAVEAYLKTRRRTPER